jgi:CubicO group peptidase (beta-lactamase class C family)
VSARGGLRDLRVIVNKHGFLANTVFDLQTGGIYFYTNETGFFMASNLRGFACSLPCLFTLLLIGGPAGAAAGFKGQTLLDLPRTEKCQEFVNFATQRKVDPRYISGDRSPLKPFETDGIVVMQDGAPVFEWYDGVMTKDSSHILWSASKMITATLLARTIEEGAMYRGQRVTMATPLNLFFPNPPVLRSQPEARARYEKITLGDLVEMSSGFVWKEYYDEDVTHSSFLPMLYLNGQKNMSEYALSAPFGADQPGEKWNYSGGNMNILMAVLGMIHGESRADGASDFPSRLLFDELGLERARVERDGSGRYIGSSYVHMSVRDMAKIGQLYLQNGRWNGKQLLPSDWVVEAQELPAAIFNQATTLDVIKKLGAPSKRIFWLNRDIYRADGGISEEKTGRKILYPREMPEAPADMYFAAGHYGQVILMIPSHRLVIARTGYDMKYWDHLQPLAVKALSCLESEYKPNPVKDLTPPSAGPKQSTMESVAEIVTKMVPGLFAILNYNFDTGLVGAILSKEMCSFLFVSDAASTLNPKNYVNEYMNRSGLPAALQSILRSDLRISVDAAERSVTAVHSRLKLGGDSGPQTEVLHAFKARLEGDSRAGCRLMDITSAE